MSVHLWLDEAEKKLAIAKKLIDHEYSEEACYFAHQAAEIALKGYARHKHIKLIDHSIVNHLNELDAHILMEKELLPLVEMGAFLDDLQQHHYPHHLEAGTNRPMVTLHHAHQAIKYATKIIQWVTSKLKEEKQSFRIS